MDVKPLLYIEIPHPKTQEVLEWLQKSWQPSIGKKNSYPRWTKD